MDFETRLNQILTTFTVDQVHEQVSQMGNSDPYEGIDLSKPIPPTPELEAMVFHPSPLELTAQALLPYINESRHQVLIRAFLAENP